MVLNPLTNSNKIFTSLLGFILVLSLLFLLVPVFAVVINGFRMISAAAATNEIRFSLMLSLRTTTEAAVICMIAGTAAGYAMHQLPPLLQKVTFSVISIPMSLPHLVSGVALLLVYGQMGIGGLLYRISGIDFVYTRQGIVLALVFVNLSYAIIMMYSSYDSNLDRLEFTARTLGCTKAKAFFTVTVPETFPTFLSAAVMTWTRALGEFGAVIMIAGSTQMKTETLPTAVYLNMATGDLDIALSVSAILIFVSVFCIVLLQLIIPGCSGKEKNTCWT